VGIAVIAGIIIYLNVSKKVKNSKVFNTGKIEGIGAKSGVDEKYRKIMRDYELSKNEIAYLKSVLKNSRSEPEEIFADDQILDSIFKQEYQRMAREIDESADALHEAETLFAIRDAVYFFQASAELAKRPHAAPRKHPRKSTKIICMCSVVESVKVKEKGKTKSKLRLTDKVFQCEVIDVSIGGCAVNSKASIRAGTQLKIEFKAGRSNVAALGQILRVNRGADGIIFHIQFLKVPPKTGCKLNAFIYSYAN
jgi:hypothetical protein